MQTHGIVEFLLRAINENTQKVKKEIESKKVNQQNLGFLESFQHSASKKLYLSPFVPNLMITKDTLDIGTSIIQGIISSSLPLALLSALSGYNAEKISTKLYKELKHALKGTAFKGIPDILFMRVRLNEIFKTTNAILKVYYKSAKTFEKTAEASQVVIHKSKELIDTAKQTVIEDSMALKKAILYGIVGPFGELLHPLIDWSKGLVGQTVKAGASKLGQATKAKVGSIAGTLFARSIEKKIERAIPKELRDLMEKNPEAVKRLANVLPILEAFLPQYTLSLKNMILKSIMLF